ncbi:MAG TPA: hypothetical protein VGF79_00410 [Bacteroidia bacterium]
MSAIFDEYLPSEYEAEKASNSYLISLVLMVAGAPIPILNLLGVIIFYFGNRKQSYFVRWHCTQALLSQVVLLFVNSTFFWWTVGVLFFEQPVNTEYIGYVIFFIIINLLELISTIVTAIDVRKGIHVSWWIIGDLTDLITKEQRS